MRADFQVIHVNSMGKLFNEINNNLKIAMKEKRELERGALRMLLAALKNKNIELGSGEKLADEQIFQVIKSEVKKRKDSVNSFIAGNRQDLADKEKEEIEILKKYMPAELSKEEIEKAVAEVISSLGEVSMGDFGKVMGAVMGKLKNQADGNTVNKIVKKALSK